MPLRKSAFKDNCVVVLICVLALLAGLVTVILTSIAYSTGYYYQTSDDYDSRSSLFTGEAFCNAIRKDPGGSRYSIPKDKKISCPSGELVSASVVCAETSLLLSSIPLVLEIFGRSDNQAWREKTWLMILASIGMCVVGLLLPIFLILVSISNFPPHPRCDPNSFDGAHSRTVETRAASAPTDKDEESCGTLRDYYFKYKLLISATVFATLSGALLVTSTFFHLKKSRVGAMAPIWNEMMMISGQQQVQSQHGGQQMITPSQSQLPQTDQQQQIEQL